MGLIQTLWCQDFPPGQQEPQESWHRFDYSISCLDAQYKMYRLLAVAAIFGLLFGIPICCFMMMYPSRKVLKRSGDSYEKQKFRFFVRDYRPGCWFVAAN
jgi:hypothetical protein